MSKMKQTTRLFKPFRVDENTWKDLKDSKYETVVLPWGATEPHNYHLPYGTDTIQAVGIVEKIAASLWEEGVKIPVLPAIPFGVQSGQIKLPLTVNLRPSTQHCMLRDIAESLENQGIKKLIIFNGHGGNNFTNMIRELYLDSKIMIFSLDWFRCLNPNNYFENPGFHADELETSTMLSLRPDLVSPLSEAGNGEIKHMKIRGIKEGWICTQRASFPQVTTDTGIGDPSKASKEKGDRFVTDLVEKIKNAFIDIYNLNIEDPYI